MAGVPTASILPQASDIVECLMENIALAVTACNNTIPLGLSKTRIQE